MATEKRLIDANALMEQLKEEHNYLMCDPNASSKIKWWEAVCFGRVRKAIEKAPTVEVVHGRWIGNGIPESVLRGCSVCGFTCGAPTFNYCPNCGAKMDGDGND